ncbi:MAG: hypothetical protein IKY10_01410 [Clostridia bacterium]|nr:hypothetical protein [Clostridia bacterium]
MEKEEKQKLVVELYKKIKIAKLQAQTRDGVDKDDLFLKPKGIRLNPKYITEKEYFQIAQFYKFLKENPELKDEEIREILNANNKFSFIRKLDGKIPDLFSELKLHGPMYIATDYASRKHTSEQLEKKLP